MGQVLIFDAEPILDYFAQPMFGEYLKEHPAFIKCVIAHRVSIVHLLPLDSKLNMQVAMLRHALSGTFINVAVPATVDRFLYRQLPLRLKDFDIRNMQLTDVLIVGSSIHLLIN